MGIRKLYFLEINTPFRFEFETVENKKPFLNLSFGTFYPKDFDVVILGNKWILV